MPALNQTLLHIPAAAPAPASAKASSSTSAASSSDGNWDLTFHNLLGIINPLQHLPVIGTLYRAITGDKIGTPEKIAGDALYGGLWGVVSSVADTAFEAATGKNFGETVLGLVFGDHDKSATAVAANDAAPAAPHTSFGDRMLAMLFGNHSAAPASVAVAANDSAPNATPAKAPPATPDITALSNALVQKGFDSDTAQRAMLAYRRTILPQNTLLAIAQ